VKGDRAFFDSGRPVGWRFLVATQLLPSLSLQRIPEQKFDLPVHAAQVVFGPAIELVQELRGKSNQK